MKSLFETLKTMSTNKEKIDYIWEYYKLHIIGIISAIIFIVMMANGIFGEQETYVEVMVVSEASLSVIEQLEQDLAQEEFDNFTLFYEHIQHRGGKVEDNAYEQMQKMASAISVGQIDFLVTDKPLAQQLLEEDLFLPLSDVFDIDQIDREAHELINLETEEAYGISTKNLDYFNEHASFEDTYIFIPATTRNQEHLQTVMNALLP